LLTVHNARGALSETATTKYSTYSVPVVLEVLSFASGEADAQGGRVVSPTLTRCVRSHGIK